MTQRGDAAQPPLVYQPRVHRPRRKWPWIIGAILVALAIAGTLGVPRLRPYWEQSKYLRWQRTFTNYSLPPETVVYEEDPKRAQALLASSDYMIAPYEFDNGSGRGRVAADWHPPTAFSAKPSGIPYGADDDLIFLHSRRVPGPERKSCLFCVDCSTFIFAASREVILRVMIADVATWQPGSRFGQLDFFYGDPTHPSGLIIILKPTDMVRLFAGQPDPSDESRFTFGYEVNGSRGVIDCRVEEFARVKMKVISGPLKAIPFVIGSPTNPDGSSIPPP